jgi:hypothetical protein
MTKLTSMIDSRTLVHPFRMAAGATAYPPLPIDPVEGNAVMQAGERPRPAHPGPTPEPDPSGPGYFPLPTEPDTRDGGGAGAKR